MPNPLDHFNSVGTAEASRVSFGIVNAIQKEPQGHQLAGLANLFLLMCERHKLDPRDVLNKSSRRLYDSFSEGRGEHIRSMKAYIEGEL